MGVHGKFLWGAATSAYQVEGAAGEDGRGESIWDVFCRRPGAIQDGSTGDTACDHYHRWREDVGLMRSLGLSAYRFSISWPRIYPQGRGAVNRRGLDFYARLVDALLEAGITPAVTLYHWDLPQPLQDRGGWTNRDTASWFGDYAETVFKALADRVPLWITLNEPMASSMLGYGMGIHAPGIADPASGLSAMHTMLLGHAFAFQAYRQMAMSGRVGVALDLHSVYPASDSEADREAARRADLLHNRWILDPLFKGAYPDDGIDRLKAFRAVPRIEPADLPLILSHKPDFLGVNYYDPIRARLEEGPHPVLGFQRVIPPGAPVTDMGWEVYPDGLYDLLMRIHRDYGSPALMVTENGAACRDVVDAEGRVHDEERVRFMDGHIRAALRARDAGAKLEAYFAWSLMDNFEWAAGYTKRFGIVHVDYHTQARTLKDSAMWYREVIRSRGGSLSE